MRIVVILWCRYVLYLHLGSNYEYILIYKNSWNCTRKMSAFSCMYATLHLIKNVIFFVNQKINKLTKLMLIRKLTRDKCNNIYLGHPNRKKR